MLNSLMSTVPLGLFALPVAAIIALFLVKADAKVLREYERAVVFTLGRFHGTEGPGLVLLIPFVQEMVRGRLAHPGDRNPELGFDVARQCSDEGRSGPLF